MCVNCLLDTDDTLNKSVMSVPDLSVTASVCAHIYLCLRLSVPALVWQDLRHSKTTVEPEQGPLQILTSDPSETHVPMSNVNVNSVE